MTSQPHTPPVELLCPECDYNLAGAPSDRCPWCGWNIDVQQLVASALTRSTATRLTVAAAALVVGLFCAVGLAALFRNSRGLGWRDALAVLSVTSVIFGLFYLAYAAMRSPLHWPMRPNEGSNILRLVGWTSIAASIVAATPLLAVAPNPLVVKGVQVNGVMEFVLTGVLYSMPGVMLLVLRMVSYRHKGRTPRATRQTRDSSGPPFLTEIIGPFNPEKIAQTWAGTPRATAPVVEEMIDRTWETESTLSEQEGRKLFDARVGRMIGAEVLESQLSFRFGQTTYREFLGTNLFHASEVARLDPACLADALGISAIVLTTDGYVVLGRRSRNVVFHAGFLHTFGGLLEEADRRGNSYDISGSVLRELEEEVGVTRGEVGKMVITGLVRDRAILQPELLFDVWVNLTRSDIHHRFSAGRDDEHAGIEFISDDPEGVLTFLQCTPKITPVGQASLLLHGSQQWGEMWYEKAVVGLYDSLRPPCS